jgi:hypothetical protein
MEFEKQNEVWIDSDYEEEERGEFLSISCFGSVFLWFLMKLILSSFPSKVIPLRTLKEIPNREFKLVFTIRFIYGNSFPKLP